MDKLIKSDEVTLRRDCREDIKFYLERLGKNRVQEIFSDLNLEDKTINFEEYDAETLGNSITAEGGLVEFLAWAGTEEFPVHLHEKLIKFMYRYEKLYDLLQEEGIYFDYS